MLHQRIAKYPKTFDFPNNRGVVWSFDLQTQTPSFFVFTRKTAATAGIAHASLLLKFRQRKQRKVDRTQSRLSLPEIWDAELQTRCILP